MSTSTLTPQTLTPAVARALPQINLLPPEIAERQQFRKVQTRLGVGVGIVTVAVLGAYVLSGGQVSDAARGLEQARVEGATLQSSQAAYAEAPQVEAQLAQESALLAQALGQDVRWSQYLRDVAVLTPKDVWLTDVSVAQAEPLAADATGATTSVDSPIATITFTGKALSQNSVAGWLDALATEPGFTDATFTNSTLAQDAELGRPIVTFSSTVSVTSEALSHRYDSTGK
jgi:Tfp pilus assembly protein PilN